LPFLQDTLLAYLFSQDNYFPRDTDNRIMFFKLYQVADLSSFKA